MELKLRIRTTATKIQNTSRVKGDKGSSLIERNSFRNIVAESEDKDQTEDVG